MFAQSSEKSDSGDICSGILDYPLSLSLNFFQIIEKIGHIDKDRSKLKDLKDSAS